MKTSSVKKFTQLLYSSLGRGILIFLVFGLAMVTYAVVFPTVEPNPASGVVGLYVGKTPADYDGDDAIGYPAVDALCDAQFSGSHVCRLEEIVNTYTHNPGILVGINDIVWVNGPAADVSENTVNDCRAWRQAAAPYFGHVWNFTGLTAGVQQCNATHAYACCR